MPARLFFFSMMATIYRMGKLGVNLKVNPEVDSFIYADKAERMTD